jgi:radical SAM protein with 4Fe4S-binding SPASM domain
MRPLGAVIVQFIGGEPTLHPDLPALLDHARTAGLDVEVFTNLVHITDRLWDCFTQPGVRLACSYYSPDPDEHAKITRRPSHARTRTNITRALQRGIPLRVGVVDLHDSQRTDDAITELRTLGVTNIGTDRLRQVGRGIRQLQASPDQLCGHCADANLAIAPDGTVWPCVFTRWMPIGNIHHAPLAKIITSHAMTQANNQLRDAFATRPNWPCVPDMCDPQCGPSCGPACVPQGNCRPVGACVPTEYR